MKTFGILLVLFSAIAFSYQRTVGQERRLRILEELFSFIERMRIDIGCYLRPISDIAENFSSPMLLSLGFFEEMRIGGAYSAYLKIEPYLLPKGEATNLLERFFSTVGNGYADEEIKLIDSTCPRLLELINEERKNVPKEKKLSLTLSCAGALALIILLI